MPRNVKELDAAFDRLVEAQSIIEKNQAVVTEQLAQMAKNQNALSKDIRKLTEVTPKLAVLAEKVDRLSDFENTADKVIELESRVQSIEATRKHAIGGLVTLILGAISYIVSEALK